MPRLSHLHGFPYPALLSSGAVEDFAEIPLPALQPCPEAAHSSLLSIWGFFFISLLLAVSLIGVRMQTDTFGASSGTRAGAAHAYSTGPEGSRGKGLPHHRALSFVVHLQKAMEKDSAPLVPVELL